MKKIFTLLFVFVAITAYSQLVEQSLNKPAESNVSKDAELLWDANWQDPAESTNGIVSTFFGGLDDYTLSADDFEVPLGVSWSITSVWTRGFLSFDDDGTPWDEPDGYGFRIYEDDGGMPGELVIDYLIEGAFDHDEIIELDLDETLVLEAGVYWIGCYGYFPGSSASDEGRWNQYMWTPMAGYYGEEPHLRDYSNLFGMADDGWFPFSAIGINFTALDFAIWGEEVAGDLEFFDVTFNVDMTGAIAEGDVAFDPSIHDVYISGSFADWAEPGSDEAFKLEPAVDKDGKFTIFFEGFEPGVESGELPEGWEVKKADNYMGDNLEDVAEDEAQWFRYSEASTGVNFDPDYVRTGEASMFVTWNVSGVGNAYAISPEFPLMEDAETIQLEYWKWFTGWVDPDSGDPWFTQHYVLILVDGEWHLIGDFEGNEDTENIYEEPVIIDLSAYIGQGNARLAFIQSWNDGIQMAIDDISVTATGIAGLHYTTTLTIEEGNHAYKYFLVEDSPSWELGEWEGDPNRALTVDGDMTVEDIFGEYDPNIIPSISEDGFTVYPNPARDIMNVVAESQINSIRIFDLSGRLIFSESFSSSQETIDVSSFNHGLYIMQIATDNGIKNVKISVSK